MPNRRVATTALIALSVGLSPVYATEGQHGLPWDTLLQLDGKYLQEKNPTATLTPSLKKALGGKYSEFMSSIKVQNPMEVENGLLIVRGMMPHSGGDFASLAFFAMDGKILAIIKKDKQLEYFGDKSVLNNPMAKETIQDFTK